MNLLRPVGGGYIGHFKMRVLAGAPLAGEMFQAGEDVLFPVGQDEGLGMTVNELWVRTEGTAVSDDPSFRVKVQINYGGEIQVNPAPAKVCGDRSRSIPRRHYFVLFAERFRAGRFRESGGRAEPAY